MRIQSTQYARRKGTLSHEITTTYRHAVKTASTSFLCGEFVDIAWHRIVCYLPDRVHIVDLHVCDTALKSKRKHCVCKKYKHK